MSNTLIDEHIVKKSILDHKCDIFYIPITKLQNKYGSTAYNVEYLLTIFDDVNLSHSGNDNLISLSPILWHAAKYYDRYNTESDAWKYIKSLIDIMKSDPLCKPITRYDFKFPEN